MKCKRLLCFFMAAALVCTGLPGMAVSAQEMQARKESVEAVGAADEEYEYEEQEDGTLIITGYGGSDAELVIPSEIGGKRVTSIGDFAFSGCNGLTSVTIPESVTSIGEMAFYLCIGLTGIDVAEGNANYASEQGILYDKAKTELICCPGGKQGSVTIPERVASIGCSAFSHCSGLTSVTIPEGVTEIGDSVFSGCGGLTSVTIPESVTSIGYSAFYGCGSLASVTIPEGVTSIGQEAFYECSGLTSVTIPEGGDKHRAFCLLWLRGLDKRDDSGERDGH